MFKSFTGRFFTIYALTTFIMFVLMFAVFSQIMETYFVESRLETMVTQAKNITDLYQEYYIDKGGSKINLELLLEDLGRYDDTRILVFNKNKVVFLDSHKNTDSLIGKKLDNNTVNDTFNGEIKMTEGYLDVLEVFNLIVTTPIFKDEEVIAAVIIVSPYPEVQKNLDYIYRITLVSLLVILAVTFLSTYIFSNGISKTIEDMNDGAKRIANGDFSTRIDIKGEDEMADLAKNMNHMANELEKLEDMRKDFIANISHDFRSPLTSIKGFIQAMLDGTIGADKQDRYLNIVLDETDRLTKLTNDILLLTKMENNTIKADKSHFDLHKIIRKILLQFEQKIIDKEIDFTLLIDRHELFVFADMNQIQRVITNLVDNAVKFCSPADSIVIETSIIKKRVEISVRDSGPGISEEDIKYIWDRFHKADRSRGKDKKGIGLGLSIVREIVKAHGEDINVYSQEGKGTTFVFTLALSDEQPS